GRVSLCFLDIDDFKQINDRFGHPAGDRVLSHVATRLRQGGEAFRLGGDEFAILMPDADETAALDAATSIVHRIGDVDLGHIAAKVAERMGLTSGDVELARLAGSRHDLGKLAIPEEILRKPGKLTEAERLVLERHPQIGFRMLESLGVDPVADWVLRHHERWDGSGYPRGLSGDDIPLGARIIFVADAF